MNWIPALALLVTIAAAEHAPQAPIGEGPLRLLLVLLAVTVVVAFSRFAARHLALASPTAGDEPKSIRRRIRLFERFRWSLWCLAVWFIVFPVQWHRVVRFDWRLDALPIVDRLLILAPMILSLVCAWAVSCEIGDDQHFSAAGSSARVGFRARVHSAFGRLRDESVLVLLPIGILLVAADVGTFVSHWTGNENVRWFAYVVGLALLIVAFPNVLRWLWRTRELPDAVLHSRLTTWAAELNVRLRSVHVWETGGRMVNAAVVGMLPRWRYVLLTDALIKRLNTREVEAVALHELAHIARRHTLWRTLVLFPPVGAYLLAQELWPDSVVQTQRQMFWGEAAFSGSVILALGFAAYAVVALAVISRLLEHDADLLASDTLRRGFQIGEDREATADFASALEKLSGGNRRRARRASWLHPSINRRLAFLRLVSFRPERGERFRVRVRWTCTLLALSPLLTAATLLFRMLA